MKAGLGKNLRPDMGGIQNGVIVSPNDTLPVVGDKSLAIQVRQGDGVPMGPGVLLGNEHHIVLVADQVGGDALGGGQRGDAQVRLTPDQLLLDDRGVGGQQLKAERGVLLFCIQVRDQAEDEVLDGFQIGEPHHGLGGRSGVPHGLFPALQGPQSVPDAGEIHFSAGGQADAFSLAVKELGIQFLFQIGDGVAQRGLGNVKLPGRQRILLALGDFLKIVQLLKIHGALPLPPASGEVLFIHDNTSGFVRQSAQERIFSGHKYL